MTANGYSEAEKDSTAGDFNSCNPLRIPARHYLRVGRFSQRFSVCGAFAARWGLMMAVSGALLLALAPSSRAQSADSQPEALSKQRAALYLAATRTPLGDLENDVNHLAMRSESCRIEYGAQACGLPDKPLDSRKLEDRFAYYVGRPVEAHSKGHGVKIDRRHWEGTSAAPAR